jgi:DNA-binding PadR family transcriptional regulator
MVRGSLLREEWRATENNRRAKYYSITDRGRRKLAAETRQWDAQTAAIARILEAS